MSLSVVLATAAEKCPPSAPFFGFMGATAALVFCCMGSSYGTAKASIGLSAMGVMKPHLVMKSLIGVIMAGILGIYGLVVSVLIATNVAQKDYPLFVGFSHLAAGLSCGLSSLAAGVCIGIVGDSGVRANAHQPKLYVSMVLILIFAEALGLYGLIVAVILQGRSGNCDPDPY
eukprot:TRINITY_DN16665_c0_g1_i1.p1 TRINITY_DN16665_c0_g1~~TRINITY_DN16665_c0_g1_i1.p1  ORF type:complete len:173 (+),score=41.35 TRINITY_DN16665_c0_g1_i1:127-645(+)